MFLISASKLRSYISCRKKYDLIYNEELEPIEKAECLAQGGSYHEKVASILRTGRFDRTGDKTDAMADAFIKYLLPQIKDEGEVEGVECYAESKLTDDIKLIGYLDAMYQSGIPIEHKTTSKPVDEIYVNRLSWDLQVALYMLLTCQTKCIYTVCQKPTIKQKMGETDEEYLERCAEWYATDTEKKIGLFEVVRTKEELYDKLQEVIQIGNEMKDQKLFFRNPNSCMVLGCPYSSICLDYDKNVMPIGFKKRENDRKGVEENDKD